MRAAPDWRAALRTTVRLNGELTQDEAIAYLVKSFADLVAYVSTFMILKPGDTFAIDCSEIGVLRNRVAHEQ